MPTTCHVLLPATTPLWVQIPVRHPTKVCPRAFFFDKIDREIWDRYVAPKHRCQTKLRCVTSLKTKEFKINIFIFTMKMLCVFCDWGTKSKRQCNKLLASSKGVSWCFPNSQLQKWELYCIWYKYCYYRLLWNSEKFLTLQMELYELRDFFATYIDKSFSLFIFCWVSLPWHFPALFIICTWHVLDYVCRRHPPGKERWLWINCSTVGMRIPTHWLLG